MSATVANLTTLVRSLSAHDNDTQVTDAQIAVLIDLEYRTLRRQLAAVAPRLFSAVATASIAAGGTAITKPNDFDRLMLLERAYGSGTQYYALAAVPDLAVNMSTTPTFIETSSGFTIKPDSAAPGNYRITYVTGVTAGYTSVTGIPDGYEGIIAHRVAAAIRVRHDEDPSFHLREADSMLREARAYLRKRNGAHGAPTLGTTTAW